MSKLASISASPNLRQYAQGAAQSATQPIADFIAPTVPVGVSHGRYKVYNEKNRFRLPNTLRATGGRAAELAFDAHDLQFNCQPHALDYPVDNLERLEAEELENILQEGATSIAEVAALVHEKHVVDLALEAAGAGEDSNFASNGVDPVSVIDKKIIHVLKAAKYGSLMSVGVVFGATGFLNFKNNPQVQKRFRQGGSRDKEVTRDNIGDLFIGNPQVRTSFMVYDDAPQGVAEDIKFVLDDGILIFARNPNPTRRDPSFMKTFRLANRFMVPGSYMRDDGRVEVAKFDWSEDVKVTNSAAVARVNGRDS